MEPENPTIPTPPPQVTPPAISPVFPKKNNLAVILLSVLLLITLLISGYLFLQVQKLSKELTNLRTGSNTSNTNAECKTCTGASDPICIKNTSCFIPAGESKGVCVPIAKTGEVYTNDQINQICGTEFGNDLTANWKTYINNEYGFSFKYPEAVVLEDRSVPGKAQIILAAQNFRETKVSASKNDLSNFYLDATPSGKATLGGISGNKYFLPKGYCDGPSCSPPILAISAIKNSTKYVFSVFVEKEDDSFTDLENQILSTFKFTD